MSIAPVTAASPMVECPLCMQPRDPRKFKPLYEVHVCTKCRNGFANRRQAAYIVDLVVYYILAQMVMGGLMAILAAAQMAGGAGRPAPPRSADPAWSLIALIGLSCLALPFLFTLKDAFGGRSPGKLLFGVQVIDALSREPIGPRQSITRNLILMIPYVGSIGGLLTMMRGRRWGDKWAGTMVVWLKRRHRVPFAADSHFCRQCGYDLTGNASGVCPECGLVVPVAAARAVCPQCGQGVPADADWCPGCGREQPGPPPDLQTEGSFDVSRNAES